MVYNYLRGRLVFPLLVVVGVVVAFVGVRMEAGKDENEEDEVAEEEEAEDVIGSPAGGFVVGVNVETSEPDGRGDFGEGKDGGVDEVFSKLEEGRVGD
ncbi:hypothetical protein C7212DRAFT_307021, partial [Tuber magnatum]